MKHESECQHLDRTLALSIFAPDNENSVSNFELVPSNVQSSNSNSLPRA